MHMNTQKLNEGKRKTKEVILSPKVVQRDL